MSKTKTRRTIRVQGVIAKAKALSHDLRLAKYEQGLHNRLGRGALPVVKPKPVTLPDPWRH